MRRTSPHHTDVFSHLPALLLRALDTEEVGQVLDELVAAGWRPGQLRHRVGAEPAQGSAERDAAHLLAFLRALLDLPRVQQDAEAPVPASPQVVAEHVAQIRAELKGVPRRREERAPRTRPACSLCAGEGSYFVTRDVHLCRRCVDVLAAGQVRLTEQTG
jgi:ribosomal protein S14